jgi:hypothetical protein
VTGFTKSHEIALLVTTAFGERKDVVDFLCGRQLSLLLAFLTERVRLDVAVTDALPASAVPVIGLGVTRSRDRHKDVLVCMALFHLLTGIRKALRDCSHKALLNLIFLIIY